MSKYDWSSVPDEVEWIATDDDGVSNGFTSKPICSDGLWVLDSMDFEDIIDLDLPIKSDIGLVWKDLLEERPK